MYKRILIYLADYILYTFLPSHLQKYLQECHLAQLSPILKLFPLLFSLLLIYSKSWMNLYCLLTEGKLTFYKDARNRTVTYNEEPPLDLSLCTCDVTMGYKKKKNVFVLK